MKRPLIFFSLLLLAGPAIANGTTLNAFLQKAIKDNPEIQQAKTNLEEASGRRLVLRSVAFPDGVIGVLLGDQGGHRAGEKSNQPFGFGYGGFTQPVFNAAIHPSFRRADLEVLIAQQQLDVAITNQLHAARTAFYSAIYHHDLSQIRDKERERLEQNVSSQKDRYQSGLVNRGMLVGAELETRELDPQIEASNRAYGDAELRLAEAIGEDLPPSATLPAPAGELKYVPVRIDLQPAVEKMLKTRPDLQLARLMVRADEEDQRIMAAAYYPIVNAEVSGEYIPVSGVRKTQSQGGPHRSDDFLSSEIRAGGAYTWRVIDNGKTYGAVKRQRSIREMNEILLRKMEADSAREMARIQHEMEGIAAKHETLSKASDEAEQNAKTVQQNLANGVVSQLEYRQAQNALLEIKSELLTLAYQQNMKQAEWDRVTGRYFETSNGSAQNVP
jgi:outer membrane protein TolC